MLYSGLNLFLVGIWSVGMAEMEFVKVLEGKIFRKLTATWDKDFVSVCFSVDTMS